MTTYTTLLARLQAFTENDESTFVAAIPDMVRRVEKRICHIVNVPVVIDNDTLSCTASERLLAFPATLLYVRSIQVTVSGTTTFLQYREPEFIQEAFQSTDDGTPRFWGFYDSENFIMGPAPLSTYSLIVSYGKYPDSMVDNAGTETWLGKFAEDAMLYGALVEAAIYMKSEADTFSQYNQRWMECLEELKVVYGARRTKDLYMAPDSKVRV